MAFNNCIWGDSQEDNHDVDSLSQYPSVSLPVQYLNDNINGCYVDAYILLFTCMCTINQRRQYSNSNFSNVLCT